MTALDNNKVYILRTFGSYPTVNVCGQHFFVGNPQTKKDFPSIETDCISTT